MGADLYITQSIADWIMLTVQFVSNGSNVGYLYVYVNNAVSTINGTSVNTVQDSTGPIYWMYNGQTQNIKIDDAALWKRSISDSERAWLYNSGNGRPCSQISDPSGTTEQIELSSGNQAAIDRSITYGEIGLIIALGIMILITIVAGLFSVVLKFIS